MSERSHYAVLAGTIAIVLLFGMFVLRPRQSQAADLQVQLVEAQSQHRALSDQLATLQEASLHRKEFESKAAAIESLLPRFPHLVRTFRLLPKAAMTAGVDLREIAPSVPSDHLTVPKAQTITVTMIVQGSYDRIESFMRNVENLDRAMQITAYSFTPNQQDGRTLISAALTTEMYLYDPEAVDESAPAPATPPAPTTGGTSS